MSFRFFNNQNTASKSAFSMNACFAACFVLLLMGTMNVVSILFSITVSVIIIVISVLLLLALGVILVRAVPSKVHEVR